MRSCTRASLWLLVLLCASACSPTGPSREPATAPWAGLERGWAELAREAEHLRDGWNPQWAEDVRRKAEGLKRSLDRWKIPEEERRRPERQLSELLESLRSAAALAKAREGLAGLGDRAGPTLQEARERVRRALEALEGSQPPEGSRPFP